MGECIDYTAEKAAEFLKKNDNYVILTHASPDGDTLGSGFALCLALRSMGKKANVVCPDKISSKFSYIICENQDFAYKTPITVDVADVKLLGDLKEQFGDSIELCIDHHITNTRYAKRLCFEDRAAACECVYNVIKKLNVVINKSIADALYTGIATDTGCFRFTNTTANTHIMAAELINLGADYGMINRIMFETKSRRRIEMERQVLEGIKFFYEGKCAVVILTREMLDAAQIDPTELDGISGIARTIEGVIVGITLREKEDGTYKVSLRTHEPVDASAICQKFGGGGHIAAAGCTFNCSADEAVKQLVDVVGEALQNAEVN